MLITKYIRNRKNRNKEENGRNNWINREKEKDYNSPEDTRMKEYDRLPKIAE